MSLAGLAAPAFFLSGFFGLLFVAPFSAVEAIKFDFYSPNLLETLHSAAHGDPPDGEALNVAFFETANG